MNMNRQIRAHRLRCNLTQEKLAQLLGVTAQAVSKWEQGASYPDITLLPQLSGIFGVKIDELFDCPEETHLNRIEAMLERDTLLSRPDFDYAEARLKEGLEREETKGRCLTLLADLYLHQAQGYESLAAEYARRALEEEPEKKDNHQIFSKAHHGALPDWCFGNHTRLIDYYNNFMVNHPDYLPGYLWLMDNLLADHRLEEARQALERMGQVEMTYHYPLYQGWIAWCSGRQAEAETIWQGMTEQYGENWLAWFARADTYAHRALYPQAIDCFQQAARRQTAPRYTDAWDAIAQLSALTGDWEGAVGAYRQVLEILRADWGLTEGETVQGYRENIAHLEAEIAAKKDAR